MSNGAIERNQVSFHLFPTNNNRTAWRPIGLPVILVVPRRRTALGSEIENSNVESVAIYIENVAQNAYVVGQDHILKDGTQLRFPARELYRYAISYIELEDYRLRDTDLKYEDPAGIPKDFNGLNPPKAGDFINYTTVSGINDKLPYFPDADYYDLSNIKIDVEILPSGYYNMVYTADFFYRTVDSSDISFICVNDQQKISATYRFGIDHPGQVLHEAYRHTPPPYLTDATKSKDTTVEFYRPFTDIINDLYDEQKLLESINWVTSTPIEVIPYLAYLIGWDLPYFPQTKGSKSLDSIRRAIIKTTVYFQNIRGSEKSIQELSSIFGLEVYAERLWYSHDGKLYIRPNESLPDPYKEDQITATTIGQVDLLVRRFVPEAADNKILDPISNQLIAAPMPVTSKLLFTPTAITQVKNTDTVKHSNQVTFEAYVVKQNSEADIYLQRISGPNDPITGEPIPDSLYHRPTDFDTAIRQTVSGINFSSKINIIDPETKLPYVGFIGKSQVKVSEMVGTVSGSLHIPDRALAPLNDFLRYDTFTNTVNLTYNGYVNPGNAVYVFALYTRVNVEVPNQLKELQSNAFNLQIITKDQQEQVDSKTLSFALDFLRKVQAFHSKLHVIRTSAELAETYEVTDLSFGGDTSQRPGTDIGMLQVPPAIIPKQICGDPITAGYKQTDVNLRLTKISCLQEETLTQNSLNPRLDNDFDDRIAPNKRELESQPGYYSRYGQDIIEPGRSEETVSRLHPNANANSQISGTQTTEALSSTHDSINSQPIIASTNRNSSTFGSFTEERRAAPKRVAYPLDGYSDYAYKGRVEGNVLHRTSVANEEHVIIKTGPLSMGSGVYYTYPRLPIQTKPKILSGRAPEYQKEYYKTKTPNDPRSFYGRLARAYQMTARDTLHFTDRAYEYHPDQLEDQAYQRPPIHIEKPTLHLPGCRFPVIGRMKTDYTNTTIPAKPWDDYYGYTCGDVNFCYHGPNLLNAQLSLDETTLTYDSRPYFSPGNNKIPDIQTLADNQELNSTVNYTESDIIHKVYTSAKQSDYVELELITYTVYDQNHTVSEPLFSTATDCGTHTEDIVDGYKSIYGEFYPSYYFTSEYEEVLQEMNFPFSGTSTGSFLYTLSSGIRTETAKRLDLGTAIISCGTFGPDVISNNNPYLRDGRLEFEPDFVNMKRDLVMAELAGIGTVHLDGQINLMELR